MVNSRRTHEPLFRTRVPQAVTPACAYRRDRDLLAEVLGFCPVAGEPVAHAETPPRVSPRKVAPRPARRPGYRTEPIGASGSKHLQPRNLHTSRPRKMKRNIVAGSSTTSGASYPCCGCRHKGGEVPLRLGISSHRSGAYLLCGQDQPCTNSPWCREHRSRCPFRFDGVRTASETVP